LNPQDYQQTSPANADPSTSPYLGEKTRSEDPNTGIAHHLSKKSPPITNTAYAVNKAVELIVKASSQEGRR
jgi:hypothetical protein